MWSSAVLLVFLRLLAVQLVVAMAKMGQLQAAQLICNLVVREAAVLGVLVVRVVLEQVLMVLLVKDTEVAEAVQQVLLLVLELAVLF